MIEQKQSLWEHLADLRKRLVWSVVGLAITCAVGISVTQPVFHYLIEHLKALLAAQKGLDLVTVTQVGLVELFLTQFNTGVKLGIAIGIPWVLYQVSLFVLPALKPSEKKWLYVMLPTALALFLLGGLFAFFFVLPPTIRFFVFIAHQTAVPVLMTLDKWMDLIFNLVIPFGLVFELPLVVGILARIGVLRAEILVKVRKYAILVIFILAAIIAPPTVIDQVFLAIPMMALYEVSIIVARLVRRKPKA